VRRAKETVWTPGPWYATGVNVRAATGQGDAALVAVCTDLWANRDTLLEEKLANATLAAASPELLTAARIALVSLNHVLERNPELDPMIAERKVISDAIDKATGGNP
jgi:hypothetical protein